MKNDFVNIDSVFNKLKHGEEKYNPQSWDNMEKLLDSDMPVGTKLRKSNKKYLLPLLLLLLIGSGLSSWYLISKNKNESTLLSSKQNNASVVSQNNPNSEPGKEGMIANTENIETKDVGNEDNQEESENKENINANEPNSNELLVVENRKKEDRKKANRLKSSEGRSEKKKEALAIKLQQEKIKAQQQKQAEMELLLANSPLFDKNAKTKDIVTEKVVEVILGEPIPTKKEEQPSEEIWEKGIAVLNNQSIAKNKDNGFYYIENRDTTKRIELLKRRNNNSYTNINNQQLETIITDTISIVKVEQVKYVPLSFSEQIRMSRLVAANQVATNAEINTYNNYNFDEPEFSAEKREIVNLVPLENFKTESKSINAFNKLKFTAGGLAKLFDGTNNLYASIIFGGNTNISNDNAYGIQAGIGLSYILAERWTLSAEFKFINKYFPKFKFTDESSDFNIERAHDSSTGDWIYTGDGNIIYNNYTVQNYNALNLPIYLSYNISSRMAIFGGANVSYILPIKWEKERSMEHLIINTRSPNHELYQDKNWLVKESEDFNNRFTLGYTAGASYDISRKISINGRVTQSLWSNQRSGLKQFDKMFRAPAFELSMNFNFGRRDKVIYIMDKK